MTKRIRIGISTCPNDTFAFHALLTGKISIPEYELDFELLDVQELNERLIAGDFDVAKGSFYAAMMIPDQVGVLSAGSALGFGVGPVLLGRNLKPDGNDQDLDFSIGLNLQSARVLCPGKWTTAAMLFRLFYPGVQNIEHVVFSEIIPALESGDAEAGVCIHEGRFTWQQRGLTLIADLGEKWESLTDSPLPLGGILARHRLGKQALSAFNQKLQQSIEYAWGHRDEALQTMRRYAQEFDDKVLWAHVELYVNQWTLELGAVGERSLLALSDQAVRSGLVPAQMSRLTIYR